MSRNVDIGVIRPVGKEQITFQKGRCSIFYDARMKDNEVSLQVAGHILGRFPALPFSDWKFNQKMTFPKFTQFTWTINPHDPDLEDRMEEILGMAALLFT